jgi:signal transduction histidine kinase
VVLLPPVLRRVTQQPLFRPLLTGGMIALALLLMLNANLFTTFNFSLTNAYFVEAPTSDQIVIVALDDASFAEFGRNPSLWDRTVYAQLVEAVTAAGARVVAFDLIFSEASEQDEVFAAALQAARNSDNRTRFVLAAAGVNLPSTVNLEDYTRGLSYTSALLPVPVLDEWADYRGYVNIFPDSDSRIRRQPSLVQTTNADDQTRVDVGFSIATYLAWLRIPAAGLSQVVTQQGDMLNVTGERTLPIDENGFWRQNFFGSAASPQKTTFPIISLKDVISGNFEPSLFEGRAVLVGIINSTGVTDQALVPSATTPMSGVEIQANALETLLQNKALIEQSRPSEMLVVTVFALGSTLAYYLVNWRRKIVLAVVFVLVYVIFAVVQFSTVNTVNSLLYPIMALTLPLLITIGFDITEEITLRIRSEAQVHLLEELNQKTEAENHLLEELNLKTEAERKNLQDLNELKTRMIRMASHDLKNPLGRVFGYAELLMMDDDISDEQRTFIKNIRAAGDEMNNLITEILDLEQLRSGAIHRANLNFNEMVAQVVTRHEPDLYRKSQTYVDEVSKEGMTVFADARQLSQAITNLVGNAVKYTPDNGTITVRVYQDGDKARFEVKDTGYGMPADALPQLFTEFYRVRTQATQNIKGTGLGLSLVKQVIDAHDGRIWVESEEGKGSTFFVELPLVKVVES